MELNILTVIYHETVEHFNMAIKAWNSFPEDSNIIAVINKKLDGVEYPDNITYIENDENCLAKAWNKGLKEIFKTSEYAIVSGLDSISPTKDKLEKLVGILKANPSLGIVAAMPLVRERIYDLVLHGDGSFSFFVISKDTFEKVGDFNEDFKPAYFEDDDYLERLWMQKFHPVRVRSVSYYHVEQGTLKYGKETKKQYPVFMQKNLELYKSIYGKAPPHLPVNIKFS